MSNLIIVTDETSDNENLYDVHIFPMESYRQEISRVDFCKQPYPVSMGRNLGEYLNHACDVAVDFCFKKIQIVIPYSKNIDDMDLFVSSFEKAIEVNVNSRPYIELICLRFPDEPVYRQKFPQFF